MRKLRIHTLGGTGASDEDEDGLRMPRSGKIEEIVRYECSADSRALFDEIQFSEEKNIIDSSQAKVMRDIEPTIATIRSFIRRELAPGESLLLPMGTDTAPFMMHSIAEGVTKKMMNQRNIFGICMQNPAPLREEGSQDRHYPQGEHVTRDFDNVLFLISEHCRDMIDPRTGMGRIGLFNGGILDPARGLFKASTGGDRAMQCRFRPIAKPRGGDAYQEGVPDWNIMQYGHVDKPRGKKYAVHYRQGIESWGFDPTSSYANLPASIFGQVTLPNSEGRDQELYGMVCQAPGSGNISEDRHDLECIHEAAVHGLAAKVPVPIVIIADPLQPHYDGKGMKAGIYGGDFSRMQEVLNQIALERNFNSGKTAVVSGGRLAKAEAKMELSRIAYRGAVTKGLRGIEFIEYVQRCLLEYEHFIETGENKIDTN